ncbi:hypothetical protein VTK26DRAFT_7931 [Humicola hyalothermophila]
MADVGSPSLSSYNQLLSIPFHPIANPKNSKSTGQPSIACFACLLACFLPRFNPFHSTHHHPQSRTISPPSLSKYGYKITTSTQWHPLPQTPPPPPTSRNRRTRSRGATAATASPSATRSPISWRCPGRRRCWRTRWRATCGCRTARRSRRAIGGS